MEGYRVVVSGTHGQIEAMTGRLPGGEPLPGSSAITHRPPFGTPETIELEAAAGGTTARTAAASQHLRPESVDLGLLASSDDGALAVAASEAIWRSIADGRPHRSRSAAQQKAGLTAALFETTSSTLTSGAFGRKFS